LQLTLNEEAEADKKLTSIAEKDWSRTLHELQACCLGAGVWFVVHTAGKKHERETGQRI
jgi:hypothetical protein